ncbi:MAG: cobalamin-dependent protein [Candidatus Micrarchaeota archaeon]|nr:cobalamin-dependent protein [Candidatus Micrarchaeota archaeon]
MKVMLSSSPHASKGGDRGNGPSTGMVYLASMLGCQKNLGLPKLADAVLAEPNIGTDNFIRQLHREKPDIFCFTPFEFNIPESKALCKMVKAESPKTRVFIGGNAVTMMPEYMGLKIGADATFRGEADFTFRLAVEQFAKEGKLQSICVPGSMLFIRGEPIKHAQSGAIQEISQNDYRSIIPDINLLRRAASDFNYNAMLMGFSRGCPKKPICSFCQLDHFFKNKALENGTVLNILGELSKIKDIYIMQIVDAMLGNGQAGAMRLLEGIISNKISFRDGYACEISVEMLLEKGEKGSRKPHQGIISLLKLANFQCEIGIESLSEGQLRKFNKDNFTFDELRRVLAALGEHGVRCRGNVFLWGADTTMAETIETIRNAFALALEFGRAPIQIEFFVTPFIGTEEYKKVLGLANSGDEDAASIFKMMMLPSKGTLKTGDENYPYILRNLYPLADPQLCLAVLDYLNLKSVNKGFPGFDSPRLFMNDNKNPESDVLAMLHCIRHVAEMKIGEPGMAEAHEKAGEAIVFIERNWPAFAVLGERLERELGQLESRPQILQMTQILISHLAQIFRPRNAR